LHVKRIFLGMETNYGIPLGRYWSKMDVKLGDSVKFQFKKKIINGKVHKLGHDSIDVVANGKYYFCRTFDRVNKIYTNVSITKSYNTK
jgi:hypothetical protein